jgi:hypothetical protein
MLLLGEKTTFYRAPLVADSVRNVVCWSRTFPAASLV